jgi:ABC-type transporter Mla subunit MlaD
MRAERADLIAGGVVAGATAIIVMVLIWTAGAWRPDTYPLHALFPDITGVGQHGPVYLRGYEIGRIRDIRPVVMPDGTLVFQVRMDVRWSLAHGAPQALPVGTTAVLKPPPVIGAAYIELELPDESGRPRLQPGDTIPGVTEPPLSRQAAQLGGGLAFDMSQTLHAARELMDSLARTTAAAHELIAATNRTLPALPALLAETQQQIDAAGSLLGELQRDAALLTPALLEAVDSTSRFLATTHALVRETAGLVDESGPELRAILRSLLNTTFVLEHFTLMVTQRPARLLTGVRLPLLDSLQYQAAVRR